MTSFEPGQIVLVRFPFTESTRSKKRPALVLFRSDFRRFRLYTLAMITSSIGLESHASDVAIQKWSNAGLPHASTIRIAKLATVDSELVEKSLGRINSVDLKHVHQQLKKAFAFWL